MIALIEQQMAPSEEFAQQMLAQQPKLRAYIRALIPEWSQADDVLGETNLVLWRKAEEWSSGTSFDAWATKVAYFQVLAHRQRWSRNRLVFDDELLGVLAQTAEQRWQDNEVRRKALGRCLERLSSNHRDLLFARYGGGLTVEQIAQRTKRSAGALRVTLHRLRTALLRCIQQEQREAVPG